MAFKLKICVQISEDCTSAHFFETTGAYDASTNPTGYGSPNPELIQFDAATLTLLLAGATVAETPIDIFGGLLFPTTDNTRVWQVNASDYGLTTFPTGLTRFTYQIGGFDLDDQPIAYAVTTIQLSVCEYECCIKEKKLDLIQNPANCACKDDRILDMLYAESQLEAAQIGTCCGDVSSVNTALTTLQTLCSDCGCGCT